jgi:hypothetical protein
MKAIPFLVSVLITMLAVSSVPAIGQVSSTSSLSGSVVDPTGAVVPGADITITSEGTGSKFKTIGADNGTFTVPALTAGTYSVTVNMPGFKQAILKGVVLNVGVPASVKITLELGSPNETIVVQGAGDVLQTQSANVSTTIVGRQIIELPFTSRNATDLLLNLPGTTTPGRPRSSSFNGLPQSAINMTLDGLNIQDNGAKNGDGFYTNLYPRVDAVEEVTLSTATPGAESAGEGAVQIKLVTRQGGNEYHGSLYEYHRNPVLNANYWFNNRDLRAGLNDNPATFKAPRDRVLLNQYGGRFGGPISLPKKIFGPLGFNGHDKAFFFVNYEEFRLPNQVSQTRTILDPLTQQGIFRYKVTVNGQVTIQQVDMMALAAKAGRPSTIDPTIANLLADIRKATQQTGSVEIVTDPAKIADPNLQRYTYNPSGAEVRIFPTMRLDFNLSKKHHLEDIYIPQTHHTFVDFLNTGAPAFPGFPSFGSQKSTRFSNTIALRSTLKSTLVNEVRFGFSGGSVVFNGQNSQAIYSGPVANQAGFNLGINAADGITSATVSPNPSHRSTPIQQFNDTLSWTHGVHTLNFGGSFTNITYFNAPSTLAPTITFGVDTTDPAASLFTTTNFPGASSSATSTAQGIYATLVGSITQIGANAFLDEKTGKYVYLGNNVTRARMREMGFFLQDSWRTTPELTLTYGMRWEIQTPVTSLNDNLSTTTLADLYGVSGMGNLFKPGTIAGHDTQFTQFKEGDQPFNTLWRNFAPSLGVAWTPKFENGIIKRIFGSKGQSVFRAGYSLSYNRDGINTLIGTVSANPGPSVTASRNMTLGNLVSNVGNDKLPVLLSQRDRLNPPTIPAAPSYPFTGALTNAASIYDPGYKMPYVMSWNIGFQRELTRDTVVEVRYVATRGLANRTSYNLNEVNIVNNGFLDEFKMAMANLQANIAAGKGNSFAYTGATGTSSLPITLAYFSGLKGADVTNPAKYTSSLFTNSTFVNTLAANNPAPYTFATNLYNNSARAANALAAGQPANLFLTNPGLQGGASFVGNGGHSYYDAGVVELRRRLSHGVLVQSSYTLARGFGLNNASLRAPMYKTPSSLVITHAFKTDWIWDLPIGLGRKFFNSGGALNALIGGWSFHGTSRLQSGAPFNLNISNLASIKLVGITRRELQQVVKMRFDAAGAIAYYLPQDIVDNTILAFNTSATSSTGYSTRGVPQGRYFAPAGSANCTETYGGQCGFPNLVLYGPGFVRFDLSLVRKTRINERTNFEFRAEFLNAFNNVNFSVGSPNNASTTIGVGADTFGRVTNAYRDISTTNDPGGRLIQFVARINF